MALTWPGAVAAGVSCGIKRSGKSDLGVLLFERPVEWAGVFTQNAAAAAPVRWCRSEVGDRARALVVNSGNANACTGAQGERAVEATTRAAARWAGCSPGEILVSSTGPIGVQLPVGLIVAALERVEAALTSEVEPFADAIMTTDTVRKVTSTNVDGASLVGAAKGGAMVAPNMATMLAFLVTDASLDRTTLNRILCKAVDRSFNRLSIDGCESTNDSVFLFSTGLRPAPDEELFEKGLTEACASLAEQMVRDAEGGTKVVRIAVSGARNEDEAVAAGRAIADSALWRAAVHGGDSNWGRVLAAAGSVVRDLDLAAVRVLLGGEIVFDRATPVKPPGASRDAMLGDEIAVGVYMGRGDGCAEILTVDLSPAYVNLNAFGTT